METLLMNIVRYKFDREVGGGVHHPFSPIRNGKEIWEVNLKLEILRFLGYFRQFPALKSTCQASCLYVIVNLNQMIFSYFLKLEQSPAICLEK